MQPSPAQTLSKTQDLILSTIQKLTPSTININHLHSIYQQTLGYNITQTIDIKISQQQQIQLNYYLLEYLITLIKQNFISIDVYQGLEEQTQRAQATIRAHIKVEQQMKMYMEYLESKVENMGKVLVEGGGNGGVLEGLRRELGIVVGREAGLQKQKINLIKKNQKLTTQLDILSEYLTKSSHRHTPSNPSQSQYFPSIHHNLNNNNTQSPFQQSYHPAYIPIPISIPHTIPSFISSRVNPMSMVQGGSNVGRKNSHDHGHSNLNVNVNFNIKPEISLRKIRENQVVGGQGEKGRGNKSKSKSRSHSKKEDTQTKQNQYKTQKKSYHPKSQRMQSTIPQNNLHLQQPHHHLPIAVPIPISVPASAPHQPPHPSQKITSNESKYRNVPTTDHQLTQKKRSGYFPGKC